MGQNSAEQVEIEYVPEKVDLGGEEGLDEEEFRKIIEKFSLKIDKDKKDDEAPEDSDSEEDEKEKGCVSKKKKKRMKIAELKQVSSRPDVVEVWDATAAESKLLVFLKSYRNTVPVPRHWCQKRKFLQGKRGIQKKQPFQLPDFIAATGIEELDLLHDAFFKYQTKPKHLSSLGDLYHEGKEFEVKLKPCGVLSHQLKEALGMPEEEGALPLPPPWLINMQRYGPPPSYPNLKIPGLNAPIPPGASFGYHPGGWGEPPVFRVHEEELFDICNICKHRLWKHRLWGGLDEKEEEMEEEEEEEEEALEAGIQSVVVVVDSLSSTPTPDVIDLRKQQKRKEPERPLYQVLEEKEQKLTPPTLLGTTHTYVVATGTQEDKAKGAKRVDLLKGQKSDKVDVTLQPEDLNVLENVLSSKYEEAREQQTLPSQREDFSHMVAENEKKRKRKMQEKEGKSKKKNFKF